MEMQCILTDITVDYEDGSNTIYYDLTIDNNTVTIFICRNCQKDLKPNPKHHIVKSLIANNKWPKRSFVISPVCNNHAPTDSEKIILPDYLETVSYPKTPSEKLDSLFIYLFKQQKIDGETIKIDLNSSDTIWIKNYFQNAPECFFYLQGLVEQKYIIYDNNSTANITHKGLNKAIELLEDGDKSKNCFVAMSFDKTMDIYRDSIKRAIIATGYIPIIIDEEHLKSDKTIPDGILSGIKKSKFCIADFTMQRNGVYFESGYALGLGKPVIYLCEKKDFENTHFDIKQLQHIIYSSPEELEKRLVEKIDVWIK